jgi:hypothetical protein
MTSLLLNFDEILLKAIICDRVKVKFVTRPILWIHKACSCSSPEKTLNFKNSKSHASSQNMQRNYHGTKISELHSSFQKNLATVFFLGGGFSGLSVLRTAWGAENRTLL